jgi:hypothetical protein
MPKFCVRLITDTTAWADVTIEAEDASTAAALAVNETNRNNANWQISDGNYIRRDDVSVEATEEIK